LLEESKNSMDLFNKKKNVSNPKMKEESKKHHYELTLSVAKMRDIVEEFIQGFAVVHNMDAKRLYDSSLLPISLHSRKVRVALPNFKSCVCRRY
jgi:hypothetical protein